MQNQVLYPPDFVGEYYYPAQTTDPLLGFPWFDHLMVEGPTPESITNVLSSDGYTAKAPTDYALGRRAVQANLATFQVVNNVTHVVNAAQTAAIQAPYRTAAAAAGGAEGWVRWAQHFCFAACHRDALYQEYAVQPSDYANRPSLAFLARRSPDGSPLLVNRCVRCPPMQAVYVWGGYDAVTGLYNANTPADPRTLLVATGECYPWWGSVPVIIPYTGGSSVWGYYFGNVTVTYHSQGTDGVLPPPVSNKHYDAVACPVNTYNARCAHYHKYDLNQRYGTPAAGATVAPQPQCTPCPGDGSHTGGRTGSWFCLPPPGYTALLHPTSDNPTASPVMGLLNMFVDARTNASLLWARRDLLKYEWECGLSAADCYQCASVPGAAGLTPDQFNWVAVLQHLLVWQPCPSGFYCPTALQAPPLPCPQDTFPWSPPGSSSLANCTCARGSYLYYYAATGTRACRPCAAPSLCGTGQYLAGYTRCTAMDGATSPGACAPCTNAPPSAPQPSRSIFLSLPHNKNY